MSRIFGWLYATGVIILLLGGGAVVLALTAGHSQAQLPIWMCGIGAALLIPEVLRKSRQLRLRRAEAINQRQQARAQRAAALTEAEHARRIAAQTNFNRFVADTDVPLTPLPELPHRRISLTAGEQCFAGAASAAHITTRKPIPAAHSDRSIVRIDAGMRYEIEAGPRNPLTDLTERMADRGVLCVTNRRVIFDGARERLNIHLEKILQVHLDGNRIILLVQDQVHPVIFHVGERYQAPVMAAAIFRLSRPAREADEAAAAGSPTRS
jgi:hypothetical protein